MGRPAAGVTSMKLAEGDWIVGMEVVTDEDYILSVSELGFGKRTQVSEYRLQSRAGKGVINMKVTNRNGKVVSVLAVKEDTDVIVISREGKILRTEAESIRKTGRSAQGVKLVALDPGDAVAAACAVKEAETGYDADEAQPELPLQ
jgi:DNA gyrase subunit A